MQIIWCGHSCFMIKTNEGKRILIDPFNISLGYDTHFPKCDLITISHNHFDHSYVNKINTDTKIINTCGDFKFDFLQLKGIRSFHDNFNGLKRGSNIIFIYKFNNFSLAHLGDLGHIPDKSVLDELNSLDLLMIPVGGNFTLDGISASNLCRLLRPRYVIPMHYKTTLTNIQLNGCKNFITTMNDIIKINSNTIDLSDLDWKTDSIKVLLLKPPY
ncbi:MBL fold metallo-hydrolase [uncultured Clostridium sp.]|uniref:MBL fold metallo-hydrolase n=1 Tax=uncultured Clostridium sp. TaxID=59620 RepID=UPI0025D75A02|nr:MBL fold metallo-hydrolase [uncultured Clostridium sp.]